MEQRECFQRARVECFQRARVEQVEQKEQEEQKEQWYWELDVNFDNKQCPFQRDRCVEVVLGCMRGWTGGPDDYRGPEKPCEKNNKGSVNTLMSTV